MPTLNTTRLVQIADDLDARASAIRDLTVRLRTRSEQLTWDSPASRACACSITGLLLLLSTCQHRCGETARHLRLHQASAARHLAMLRSAEKTVKDGAKVIARLLP
jgi:hypothetical protein